MSDEDYESKSLSVEEDEDEHDAAVKRNRRKKKKIDEAEGTTSTPFSDEYSSGDSKNHSRRTRPRLALTEDGNIDLTRVTMSDLIRSIPVGKPMKGKLDRRVQTSSFILDNNISDSTEKTK
jgi:hypothetical protein